MYILKFGGTSVATADTIRQVLRITQETTQREEVCMVVSALGGVTNLLLELVERAQKQEDTTAGVEEIEARHVQVIRDLIPLTKQSALIAEIKTHTNRLQECLRGVSLTHECSPRLQDEIVSFGERLSAFVIAHAGQEVGLNTVFADARNLIRTNSAFGRATVDREQTNQLIRQYCDTLSGKTPIVTGFIAADSLGRTTTLGRGGSDYTAAILGNALDADEIQIWTDVSGVYTTNPKKVPTAFPLEEMSYAEAMEMAHFGAKVIYAPTIQPAYEKNIPLRIKNTFAPKEPGTLVRRNTPPSAYRLRGISSIDHIALLLVQGSGMVGVRGFAARLFSALAEADISIIFITQASSEHSICLGIEPKSGAKAVKTLEQVFAAERTAGTISDIHLEENYAIVSAVGDSMRQYPGTAGQVFAALGKAGVNIHAVAQGSSERNISLVVDHADEEKALKAIHQSFFESKNAGVPASNAVFLAGAGLVGSAFARQLVGEINNPDVYLSAIATSKNMILSAKDVPTEDLREYVTNKGVPLDTKQFIERAKKEARVFVDATPGDSYIPYYEGLLRSGVSVVTPNKKALSGTQTQYESLKAAARAGKAHLGYETNVGAGLPVISTLDSLLRTGDSLIRIEGILSGTLSYLFNTFDGKTPFSTLVRQAKEAGYTEPDPRDDLSGMDVLRKIIILARDAGFVGEPDDVPITPFLSDACFAAPTVEDFFTELEKEDDPMARRMQEAANKGQVLRYVASFDGTSITMGLQAFAPDHPFATLQGSDNMIVFTTKRYKDNPLVIRGPGAGADVTAAGVLWDTLSAL